MKARIYILLISLLILVPLGAQEKLIILHTNDTHSRIEPLPSTDKRYANMAGVVNRKSIIDSIKQVEKNVLLVDAGDIVQGTPYFNIFHGEVETTALNKLNYEVGTIGNHEFDNGMEQMHWMLKRLDYPIVNCNYDFATTPLKGMIKPYVIIKKGKLNVAIIGVGVDPEGLIQKDKYEGMTFMPIIESVNSYAEQLKDKCDVIIALTHIGIEDDRKLAAQSKYIDLIIGGHSHTYMDAPEMIENQLGKKVLVYQVGRNGAYVGKIELELEKHKK